MTQLDESPIDRVLTLEIVRVTERAAIAAARMRGRGDERIADEAAVDAMLGELNRLRIRGRIVIGGGEKGETPKLFNGEEVGTGEGPELDIALDSLEGATICAKNLPNSLSVIAFAGRGGLLNTPDVYMEKLAIGPGYQPGIIDLEMPPAEAIRRLAAAKGVRPEEVSACVLDRPRNGKLIEIVRSTGAGIRLIPDGDVAGVIHTTDPGHTGIDIYLGSGGAPEGVLAAAALRGMGGQMCGRLICDTEAKAQRARQMGIADPMRSYRTEELASGDVLFAATGVTDGNMLDGVTFQNGTATTHSIVTRSRTGTQRWVKTVHRLSGRSGLE